MTQAVYSKMQAIVMRIVYPLLWSVLLLLVSYKKIEDKSANTFIVRYWKMQSSLRSRGHKFNTTLDLYRDAEGI